MADISTRMSVTGLSEYKKAMNDAKAAVKTLDAELKLNEAQYKANGDAEQYMANKAGLLKTQIDQQTKVVQNAEAALKQMEQQGTKSGAGYEKMRQQVYNSTQKLVEMRTELQQVENGAKIPLNGWGEEIFPEGKPARVYLDGMFWGIAERAGNLMLWKAQISPE